MLRNNILLLILTIVLKENIVTDIKNFKLDKNVFKKKKLFYVIIFLGFCFSAILSSYYVLKYDRYVKDSDIHQLIKDETFYHWNSGAIIADEVRKGKNFFSSGGVTFTKPLQQRIIALYSLITGFQLTNDSTGKTIVSLGGKLPYLILQALFYFFSLFYFGKKLLKIFPNNAFLYIILFLSFEFTIFQFHSSFWTESIYFSLQLIIFGMVLEKKANFSHNLLIGILIGFLFLQRSAGLFYIFPILICNLFFFKKKITPVFIGLISGYITILILLSFYNYHKTNKFYIFPLEGKHNVYSYFASQILAEKLGLSSVETTKFETDKFIKWANKNNIKFNDKQGLDEISNILEIKKFLFNDTDVYKFYDYLNFRQYEILINNPLVSVKKIINNTMHLIVLDPTFNYYYNDSRGKNKTEIYFTDTHKKLIPYRIAYTLIIYFFCLIGLISMLKQKKFYEVSIIFLSVLYYVALFGWKGDTRLYVPSLIYLSIFFGIGVDLSLNNFKRVSK